MGSNLLLTERELSKRTSLQDIQKNLSLPNPEFIKQKRFGKFYKKVEPQICYLRKVGENYIVPRYYFGEPTTPMGERGRELTSDSKIKLRDYQTEFFTEYGAQFKKHTGILVEAPCGHGKCHGKGTRILMYDGSIKNVEDIVVGDLLMGDDSTPRTVLSLARGREPLLRVKQTNGEAYVVNQSHILSLQYRPWGSQNTERKGKRNHELYGTIQDISIQEYQELPKTRRGHLYGYNVPIAFEERPLTIDPYLLGCWLGDGTSKEISFTCDSRDRVLIRYYKAQAEKHSLRVSVVHQDNNRSNVYRLCKVDKSEGGPGVNTLRKLFTDYDLLHNKHIPEDFIVNSKENRLQLLAGLLDTDGHLQDDKFEITQKRKNLILDIQRLCWTLGFKTHLSEKVIKGVSYWRLFIKGNTYEIPTKLKRKQASERKINKDPFVTGISLEELGEGDYYGFTLDGNHRYCLQDGTVTHNTVCSIHIAYMRGVQSLILVPTYYLAKQWKQRIEEMTTASVFIIQSTTKEMPLDADFTIMVMDLFTGRELPSELIKNVGHVILDEAHRIGAETYLPILDSIPAMYRTALTATFRRTDGVHKILKYHFGEHLNMPNRFPRPRVYGLQTGMEIKSFLSKNKPHTKFVEFLDAINYPYNETKGVIHLADHPILKEKAEEFKTKKCINQTQYNEITRCIRQLSQAPYTTLDSYLTEHPKRMKVVISLIQQCLDAGRTILFLSKRKGTLKTLNRLFAKYKPMMIVSETSKRTPEQEEYLQNECKLILGVTQLAKEGLDIDRLDTLIIHLPMKDTEQAIGRISRLCEGKCEPICFYLLDKHPITFAVFNNAKKFMKINADYKGERTLATINTIL